MATEERTSTLDAADVAAPEHAPDAGDGTAASASSAAKGSRAQGETPEIVPLAERITRIGDLSDGSIDDDDLDSSAGLFDSFDRVATFGPAILAIRWGTTALSVGLAAPEMAEGNLVMAMWSVVVIAYSVLRTQLPIRYMGNVRSLTEVIAEATLHVLVLATTGFWESPFVFTLITAVTVAGFARGFGFALRIASVSAMSVNIPYLMRADASTEEFLLSVRTSAVLLLIAVVSGWARRISGEADRQRTLALHRLDRLSDANALLSNLHRVAQTLPASLDIDDVMDTTLTRLRSLVEFDAVVVAALDDTDAGWDVLRREGCRAALRISGDELLPVLARAVAADEVVVVDHALQEELGFSNRATSGIYAPLPARGAVMGFLALERTGVDPFNERDLRVVRGFAEPMGLAIDNARWFARLRTVGADEERTRIARDLHDRIGQSLAYLAFELDRIVGANERGTSVGPDLDQLRNDVRGVIGEVRDTLYDLRTDVSESNDLASTVEQYVARVRDRSGLAIHLLLDRKHRLPILQERELWRICQEALTNIERHADAAEVRIEWRCDGRTGHLEISDDGRGFPVGSAGRLDSYGILGMRERASSIGATLELLSEPGAGSTVRCSLIPPLSPAHR